MFLFEVSWSDGSSRKIEKNFIFYEKWERETGEKKLDYKNMTKKKLSSESILIR